MDPEIKKQGDEALLRLKTLINNLYWNARMEVKSDFNKGRMKLGEMFVPESYGITPIPVDKSKLSVLFPESFQEFTEQKKANCK